MHFIILSIITLGMYVPATGATRAVTHRVKMSHIAPLIAIPQFFRLLYEVHHKKTRLDVLTSQTSAPKLPPPLASLCLDYAQLQPPFPGIMHQVARVTIPHATVYKFTLTNNNRMMMAISTTIRCPCIACKDSGDLQLYEIDPISFTPKLLLSMPIGDLGFTITRQTRIAASNDGQYVAFYHREKDRGKNAWLLNLSTGIPQKIGTNVTAVSFSSDNSRLAYACAMDRCRYSLTLVNLTTDTRIARIYGIHADCCGRQMHIVTPNPVKKYTSLFFDIDSETPEIPCYSITHPTPPNASNWPEIIAKEYNKINFAMPRGCTTPTKSDCSSSSSSSSSSSIQTPYSHTRDSDKGNNYFIKEGPAVWPAWPTFFLCSTAHPYLGLAIPYAENVQYIPDRNMLISQTPIYAAEKGIRIFVVKPDLADLVAKLDTTTREHLANIVKLRNEQAAFYARTYSPNETERLALDQLQKISPELYENFMRWCNIALRRTPEQKSP